MAKTLKNTTFTFNHGAGFDETMDLYGVKHDSELYDILSGDIDEDDEKTEWLFNPEITPHECVQLGAETFTCGDGWDDPITYHLRGDAQEVAERYVDNLLDGNTGNSDAINLELLGYLEYAVENHLPTFE